MHAKGDMDDKHARYHRILTRHGIHDEVGRFIEIEKMANLRDDGKYSQNCSRDLMKLMPDTHLGKKSTCYTAP